MGTEDFRTLLVLELLIFGGRNLQKNKTTNQTKKLGSGFKNSINFY